MSDIEELISLLSFTIFISIFPVSFFSYVVRDFILTSISNESTVIGAFFEIFNVCSLVVFSFPDNVWIPSTFLLPSYISAVIWFSVSLTFSTSISYVMSSFVIKFVFSLLLTLNLISKSSSPSHFST